jgi:hypothetical protein
MKHCFHVAGVLLAAIFVAKCHSSCKPVEGPTDVAVEAAYTAELLSCVDRWPTKTEQAVCRVEVNRKWGLCGVDGGAEKYPDLHLCGN